MGNKACVKRIDLNRPLRNLYPIFLVGIVLATGHYFFQGKESFLQVMLMPLAQYAETRKDLVTSSECILCGRCVDVCRKKALKISLVWNRKAYRNRH
jgi:ferredoxin